MEDLKPAVQWPAGHRSALSLVVHVPGFGFSEAGTDQEDLLGLDYTATGIRNLFRTLEDLDVSATFAFTAEARIDVPELVTESYERGHEVAASFCSAGGAMDDLVASLSEDIGDQVNGVIARVPGFPTSELDDAWGNDGGKAWLIDGRSGDIPTMQSDPDAALIPISPYLMDTAWLSPVRPLPPSSLLETWMYSLEAARTHGLFTPIIVHPHIIGRHGLLGTLTRFLDDVIAYGDVWIARLDHIAATWHAYNLD